MRNKSGYVVLHMALIGTVLAALLMGFFYVYLPRTTHHGSGVAVPNLLGKPVEAAQELLTDADLAFEVSDTTYDPRVRPNTVLVQFPRAGATVKEARKIFLTIATPHPPQVALPDVVNLTPRSAEMLLQSAGLLRGNLRYLPEFSQNVLRVEYLGKTLGKKASLPRGARVDLVIGDGIGPESFEVPNVLGRHQEEATLYLRAYGLKVRAVIDTLPVGTAGTVVKQVPLSKPPDSVRVIRRGETVQLVIFRRLPKLDTTRVRFDSVPMQPNVLPVAAPADTTHRLPPP